MSREDPQLRIRLPIELKEKIEESAKVNNRSMNAEIVQRLDMSFLDEESDEVISAKDALQIASNAKGGISDTIFKRTFAEINKKARMGHKSFCITTRDLELDVLSNDDFHDVFDKTLKRLKELGYEVPDKAFDCDGFLIEIPNSD